MNREKVWSTFYRIRSTKPKGPGVGVGYLFCVHLKIQWQSLAWMSTTYDRVKADLLRTTNSRDWINIFLRQKPYWSRYISEEHKEELGLNFFLYNAFFCYRKNRFHSFNYSFKDVILKIFKGKTLTINFLNKNPINTFLQWANYNITSAQFFVLFLCY